MVNMIIIKDIIDVAKALFGFRDSLAKAQKEKRDQMADYFHGVSVCLAATYEGLTSNVVPHGRCAELSSYADSLPEVVKGFIEESKAQELSHLLKRSYRVEGLWEEFNANPEKRKELPIIAEASGIFLALSNSVRAGFKPGN
jgi:hypothetical protein